PHRNGSVAIKAVRAEPFRRHQQSRSLCRHPRIVRVVLLLTCAPLVFGYLGRLIRSQNLTAAGLADQLRSERAEIDAALPAGFEVPGVVRRPHERTRIGVDETMRRAPQRERSAFPFAALLLALGSAGLIWWTIDSARHRELPRRAKVENTTPN